jgi:hypothetical protein
LGGAGPDDGPEELRFSGVGTLGGASFDLVLKTTSPYVRGRNPSGCTNGKFGRIMMRYRQEVSFEASFRSSATDAPVTLPAFWFSFFDIEGCNRDWIERFGIRGHNRYVLDNGTFLGATPPADDPDGLTWFRDVDCDPAHAGNFNNPNDPKALTEEQKRLSVSFEFLFASQFSFTLKSGSDRQFVDLDNTYDGLQAAFFFAGASNILVPCPPAPPSPPSPPSTPPRPPPPQPAVEMQSRQCVTTADGNIHCLQIPIGSSLSDEKMQGAIRRHYGSPLS